MCTTCPLHRRHANSTKPDARQTASRDINPDNAGVDLMAKVGVSGVGADRQSPPNPTTLHVSETVPDILQH